MKKAFALIYTMMFVALAMLTMSSIAVLSTSGSRQMQQSKSATQAYQLAQSAIEDGIQSAKNGQNDPVRVYLDGLKRELPSAPLDNTKTKQGYYEFSITGGKIKGTGFSPWGKSFVRVTLEADPNATGYRIYQVGN